MAINPLASPLVSILLCMAQTGVEANTGNGRQLYFVKSACMYIHEGPLNFLMTVYCLLIRNNQDDPEFDCSEVSRKYTPVSCVNTRGTLELIVKVYKGRQIPAFPDGGKISQHLGSLSIGDQVECSGPFGWVPPFQEHRI